MRKNMKTLTHEMRVKKMMELKRKQERLIKIISAVMLCFTLVYLTSTITSAMNRKYEVVTVKKGQTLWQIAEKYNTRKDIRSFIRDISNANGIHPDQIVSGQELMIPLS